MPVSGGSAASKCVNASSPPADAPMPTIGKGAARRGSSCFCATTFVGGGAAAVGAERDRGARFFWGLVLGLGRGGAERAVFRGRVGTVTL